MKKKSREQPTFFFQSEKMLVGSEVFFHVLHPEFNDWFRYPLIDIQKVSRLTWYTFFLSAVFMVLFVPVWALRDTEPMKNMAFYSQKNYKLRQVNSWPKQHSFSYATW